MRPVTLIAALLAGLSGCGSPGDPALGSPGEDEPARTYDCPGTDGDPRFSLTSPPPDWDPLDSAVYEVRHQYQGMVVIIPPLWIGGLAGGEVISDFGITFTDEDGVLLGERHNHGLQVTCLRNDVTGADWLEVFFDPGTPRGSLDGVRGTVEVTGYAPDGAPMQDAVEAVLKHPLE